MASHAEGVNAMTVLPQCTEVFGKTLGLPCKHKIQESYRNPDQPLRRNHLHPHWWLNPLEDEQPVEPWARIQPPVRTRRRGRPRNPRREPSAFEIAQAQAAARRTQNQANGEGEEDGNRGGNGGRRGAQRGRGRSAGRRRNVGRDRENARNPPPEDAPRRLRQHRRGQPQDDISDEEFVLIN